LRSMAGAIIPVLGQDALIQTRVIHDLSDSAKRVEPMLTTIPFLLHPLLQVCR